MFWQSFFYSILRLVIIPTEDNPTEKRYSAYIINDKLGLQKLPLTGNPFDSVAILAHPSGVSWPPKLIAVVSIQNFIIMVD